MAIGASTKRSKSHAIVGAVVGVIITILLLIVGVWFLHQRRRRLSPPLNSDLIDQGSGPDGREGQVRAAAIMLPPPLMAASEPTRRFPDPHDSSFSPILSRNRQAPVPELSDNTWIFSLLHIIPQSSCWQINLRTSTRPHGRAFGASCSSTRAC